MAKVIPRDTKQTFADILDMQKGGRGFGSGGLLGIPRMPKFKVYLKTILTTLIMYMY